MAYIDDAAVIAAVRRSSRTCVTAATDSGDFLAPVKLGDFVILEAFVPSTHKTSLEIIVKVLTESLKTGEKIVCTTAFLTFVALEENGKRVDVPGDIPRTEQKKDLYEGAELRRERRSERRSHSFKMANKFSEEIIKRKE